jgi:hypothetical protein
MASSKFGITVTIPSHDGHERFRSCHMLNLPSNSGLLMLGINQRSRWWLFTRSERKISMDLGVVRSMQWIYNFCNLQKNINRLEELGLREFISYFGEVFFRTSQRKEWTQDKMENRRTGVVHWSMELQEEEHEAMVNQLNILQIRLNEASIHWKTTMEILVEQRQGYQQLKDEVEAIRSEVVELHSQPVNPVQSASSSYF